MTSTFAAGSSRSSRPATRAGSSAVFIALAFAAACASNPAPPQAAAASSPDEITYYRVPILLPSDSAVKLARFALSTINGTIKETPSSKRILVSTQYTREGATFHRQITIVAAVQRAPADAQSDTTFVELSAWAVDQVEAKHTRTLSGRPIPRLQSNAPIGSVPQDRPYLITASKAPEDWRTMQDVLGALVAISPRPRP